MKPTIILICVFACITAFAQEKKTSKGQGTDKHTPANKDYDKPISKQAGKAQIRKSGNNTNGLADTTRQLAVDEQNTENRTPDFTASSSGSPSVGSENRGLSPDGTNTVQRASYNMAGSPVVMKKQSPKVEEKSGATTNKTIENKKKNKKRG